MKTGRLFPFLLLFFISFLLQSCKKDEVEIIPEEKFISIYVEILAAQDTLGTSAMFIKPELEKILKRNGVSRKLYDETIKFYMKNPEDYKAFMVGVDEKLTSLKESVERKP